MKHLILAIALVIALPSALSAQSGLAANEVYAKQSFQLVVDHDGLDVTHYRLYRNGVQVEERTKTDALSGNVVTFSIRTEPGAATVTYTTTAVNFDGSLTRESAPSPAFSLTVKNEFVTPKSPTIPRIIRLP